MHPLVRSACRVLAAGIVVIHALPAQDFDELTGRGLPRALDDTVVAVLADFDGDGHVDLLSGVRALYPGALLDLARGDADGVFTPAPAGSLPAMRFTPAALVAADFDGDGRSDVFVANRDLQPNALWLARGTGLVDRSAQLPRTATDSRAAAAGDLDGDGDLDLVVANVLGPDELLLNDGTGRFVAGPALPDDPSDEPTAVVLVDVDRDGALDVVVGNATGRNRLWRNVGGARFVDVTTVAMPVDTDVTTAVAAADFDGDGFPDLLIGNRAAPTRLYRNLGGRVFWTSVSWTPSEVAPTSCVAAFDADGDGDVDAVVGRHGAADALWTNDGAGVLRAAPGAWPAMPAATNVVVTADVDGDRDVDVVMAGGRSQYAPCRKRLLLNDGTGGFASATAVAWPSGDASSAAIAVADLDGDGSADIAVGSGSDVELWLGDGFGSFAERRVVSTDIRPDLVGSLTAGDVDGDGDVDLVVGTDAVDLLLRNDGSAGFTVDRAAIPPAAFDTRAIVLVDVDGDGDLDAVEANAGSNPAFAHPNRLLLNDGGGRFTDASATRLPAGAELTFGLAAGDVDGDGDVDLVFGNWSPPGGAAVRSRLLLNDGRGGFADAPAAALSGAVGTTSAVALGDLDGDGDLDLFLAQLRAAARVYRNDGTGRFVHDATATPPSFAPTAAIALADADGDGDLDVWIANDDAPNGLYRNDGRGRFVEVGPSVFPALRAASAAVAVADVDGDGDADVLFANRAEQKDWLWFNLGRHVDVPLPIRSGRRFDVDVYARAVTGPAGARLWLSLRGIAPLRIGNLGVLRLDPATLLDFGSIAIQPSTGAGTGHYVMPPSPNLVGRPLYLQAVTIDGTTVRLTNAVRRVVGS